MSGILDATGRRQWGEHGSPIYQFVADSYGDYSNDTKGICDSLKIDWIDCNALLPNDGWLFCDRIHLTDLGYKMVMLGIQSKMNLIA